MVGFEPFLVVHLRRPASAFVGCCGSSLAAVGLSWPSLAFVGSLLAAVGLLLACLDLRWATLAVVGYCGPLLAFGVESG